jgi:hypothetical protein
MLIQQLNRLMDFRNWLLSEEGNAGQEDISGGGGDTGWDWDVIYPSEAGDYPIDVSTPKYFWWLQWRWKRGQKIGRPLLNIDLNSITGRDFVAPYSKTLPGKGFWKNKKEEDSNLGIWRGDLTRLGVGKSEDEPLVLKGNMVAGHPFPEMPPGPPSSLDRLFGKAPQPINRLPSVPSKSSEGGPRKKP